MWVSFYLPLFHCFFELFFLFDMLGVNKEENTLVAVSENI